MPQINRIRVNNVKYNFGTQFYDDFLMRFSCKNAIYDLANGGGKSVLMLMLLQNLIPNCTLDEKQPIEKLFRTNEGSTTIHSLIEWKLDSCYIKEGFKYMTTGFCARKAKESEEEKKDTAGIEYFNYCIFYREFGDNDIKNLPLSNGKERITYQGLKNYLKDLEKKDFGVKVKIFERKNEYQKFLTQYGIFESQWEIVRGINKTEGHVRTYFESNYKTARKVVEDLLIEEIIEKSFANRIGTSVGDDGLAKTLLDIKDKLNELSKRKDTIDNYDKQIEAMNEFAATLNSFKDLYRKKEELRETLLADYFAVKNVLAKTESDRKKLEQEREAALSEKDIIERDILIGDILEDEKSLEELSSLLEKKEDEMSQLYAQKAMLESELTLAEAGVSYREYLSFKAKRDEVKATIDNRLRDFEDIRKELAVLSKAMKLRLSEERSTLEAKLSEIRTTQNETEIKLSHVKSAIAENDKNAAVADRLIAGNKEADEKDIACLTDLMKTAGLLVADDVSIKEKEAQAEINKLTEDISRAENVLCDIQNSLVSNNYENMGIALKIENADGKISANRQVLEEVKASFNKAEKLLSVYGAGNYEELLKKLSAMIKAYISKSSAIEADMARLKTIYTDFSNGVYSFDEPQYQEIKNYLTDTYGEDVVTGDVWLKTLPRATRRDIVKRVPFVTHAIIVRDDFERIKADVVLRNIARGAYAVPVVGEGILYETRNAVNSDNILFAMKDISFLGDEQAVAKELSKLDEEMEEKQNELNALNDRADVIREDYAFVLEFIANDEKKFRESNEELSALTQERQSLTEAKENVENEGVELKKSEDKTKNELKELIERRSLYERNIEVYADIKEISEKISAREEDTQNLRESLKSGTLLMKENRQKEEELEKRLIEVTNERKLLEEKLTESETVWENQYLPYYDEKVCDTQLTNSDISDIKVRFNGLKAVIDREVSDISDKEKLYETYDAAVKKAVSDIEYLDISFDEAAKLYEEGRLSAAEQRQLFVLKDSIKAQNRKIEGLSEEIRAQSAAKSRLEGSLEHQHRSITEKFGEFEKPSVSSISLYKEEKKNLLADNRLRLADINSRIKINEADCTSAVVTGRDIERIVKNAGITVPSDVLLSDYADTVDEEHYDRISSEFDRLIKEESKRKEVFLKDKQALTDKLEKLLASPLAFEIKDSFVAPKDADEAVCMMNNIAETNKFIELEKSRVNKGIEDMQKIKDSFENRCIQTCMNIKAELERLPKLSRITLDDEVISIIGLNIPYVKEEFIKDRMSAYIEEITLACESFKEENERLKYIKGKLTWKKLFSVIVTDMNDIKLSLYKRERIKEQSRYLRYEEAVGSTGQSQGIYIQFLIAVINYISSINAAGNETGVIGKTIFIDNPFGAAKDVYIWEPIFKLLKTNHVQLIVPARGTTPAITGRFDVNYILGQQLVDGKQQTVVVDYHSRTKAEELEYTRLSYTQEMFDFL